mgnify:CR=1 FL=1
MRSLTHDAGPSTLGDKTDLILVFGDRNLIQDDKIFAGLKEYHPKAVIIGCSTAGEIMEERVSDGKLIATFVQFEKSKIRDYSTRIETSEQSFEKGREIGAAFPSEDLQHVFVLSDGLKVNGSELVAGLSKALPLNVRITGGLAGDGTQFKETFVCHNGPGISGQISAIGFYGSNLRIGFGSLGGWDTFGPQRIITRSNKNILYEMDGYSALEIYKKYLGEHAANLPSSGLLFPLSITTAPDRASVVRTILAVNEEEQSIIFAGDIPQGAKAQLMKANFNRLIDGAIGAARISYQHLDNRSAELAILISCVGRKMVLKQRVEEEVEGVRDVLGPHATMTGFYSYGEISPMTTGDANCELHNQTMTITTLQEV